jgi:lipopolysaccharide export system permease protein
MKRLHRYILTEFAGPMGLSLLVFTFVLLTRRIDDLIALLNFEDVEWQLLATVIGLLLPFLLTMTLPMGLLIACLTVFSRWNTDRELLILRTSGINPFTVLKPILVMGLVSTMLVMYFTTEVVPWTYSSFRGTMYQVATRMAQHLSVNSYNRLGNNLIVYVKQAGNEAGSYKGLTLFFSKDGRVNQMLTASDGQVKVDPDKELITLQLSNGSFYKMDPKDPTHFYIGSFDHWVSQTELGKILNAPGHGPKKRREYTLAELKDEITKETGKAANTLKVEFHERFAIPFACMVFVLMGFAFGSMWRVKNKTLGFFLGVLLIGVYWILLVMGESLGIKGKIPAFLGVWAPNIILGGLGIYLSWKTCRQ